jgi:hypothetical protein
MRVIFENIVPIDVMFLFFILLTMAGAAAMDKRVSMSVELKSVQAVPCMEMA